MSASNGLLIEQLDSIEELGGIFLDIENKVLNADYSSDLDSFQSDIVAGEADAFANQREPGGTPWEPLKPSTVARKGHSRILFESGALAASLVSLGGPGNINAVTPRGLLLGTDVEYALFHQDGTAKMPARPPVGMSEETLDKLADGVADSTVEKMKYTLNG